ncbi:DUF4381 domain-containing protein [Suttonella ornithocola]|uniref:DUF4381 domain-containing protein n=1 Tax=Suttonella ornithocola TaxID=279832 RepID=A0A380MXI2_9GAMM|nr:DUF4381 domain-containing protein [Suttonella ornithocola]SUO96988.1 Uncharacterised protein [Suttonella ornithocola]
MTHQFSPLELQALKQLDLTLRPRPLAFWEQPWFWVMVAALVILFAVLVFLYIRHRRRQGLKHSVLAEFEQILAQQETLPTDEFAAALSALLRRIALLKYEKIGVVYGKNWAKFLSFDGSLSAETVRFLSEAPYRPDVAQPQQAVLASELRRWISKQMGGIAHV